MTFTTANGTKEEVQVQCPPLSPDGERWIQENGKQLHRECEALSKYVEDRGHGPTLAKRLLHALTYLAEMTRVVLERNGFDTTDIVTHARWSAGLGRVENPDDLPCYGEKVETKDTPWRSGGSL